MASSSQSHSQGHQWLAVLVLEIGGGFHFAEADTVSETKVLALSLPVCRVSELSWLSSSGRVVVGWYGVSSMGETTYRWLDATASAGDGGRRLLLRNGMIESDR